jgi:hypothetical protein
MSDKESIRTHVFRTRIEVNGKEHGMVGFDRHGDNDCLRIVSWANDKTEVVEFDIEAAPALAALILWAYETRTRPNEHSCYAFRKPNGDKLPTIAEMSGLVHDFTNGKSMKEYMEELSDE